MTLPHINGARGRAYGELEYTSSLLILTSPLAAGADFDCDCLAPPLGPDNDCHHPDAPWPEGAIAAGPYVRPAGVFTAPLPHGFTLAHSPWAVGPVALGPRPGRRYARFRQPAPLRDDTDRRLARLALLRPLDFAPAACATPPQMLTAWLHVSNACNLDCPYCYCLLYTSPSPRD